MRTRNPELLDQLELIEIQPFSGTAWRLVRKGYDVMRCSASGGRWDDKSFDVLYTSLEVEGAKSEVFYHLTHQQPVFPSKLKHELYELSIHLECPLKLASLGEIDRLGIKVGGYSSYRDYREYQELGEAAYFLEFDGLLVPSARYNSLNAVLFCDRIDIEKQDVVENHGVIDWTEYRIKTGHKP